MSYPASKAGGEGLIRGLAKELGPKGVNVNAIAPRLIDTGEMMRVNYPTQADLDAVLEKIPVRRLGTIDDVANMAIFLAVSQILTSRDRRSSWMVAVQLPDRRKRKWVFKKILSVFSGN